jgi:hypothetical protein
MKPAVQHFMCMMSCDEIALVARYFFQQFGQENQHVNEYQVSYSATVARKKTIHLNTAVFQ